jgi:hypothetical protein
MRGFLSPAKKLTPTETQTKFAGLSRGRRSKIAKAAQTTLVKADQWGRGEAVVATVASALEKATQSVGTKK